MKTFKQKIGLQYIENFIISQLSRQAHFNIFSQFGYSYLILQNLLIFNFCEFDLYMTF